MAAARNTFHLVWTTLDMYYSNSFVRFAEGSSLASATMKAAPMVPPGAQLPGLVKVGGCCLFFWYSFPMLLLHQLEGAAQSASSSSSATKSTQTLELCPSHCASTPLPGDTNRHAASGRTDQVVARKEWSHENGHMAAAGVCTCT